MQSRSFFTFGANFNFSNDSIFINQVSVFSSSSSVTDELGTEDGNVIGTETGNAIGVT